MKNAPRISPEFVMGIHRHALHKQYFQAYLYYRPWKNSPIQSSNNASNYFHTKSYLVSYYILFSGSQNKH